MKAATGQLRVFVSANLREQGFARLSKADSNIRITGAPAGISLVGNGSGMTRRRLDADRLLDADSAALLAEAEILIASKLPADLPEKAPGLRWIHITSAGLDETWHPYLADPRYLVTSARGVHAIPISEFVLCAMLALARDLPKLLDQQAGRRWEKFCSMEIAGRTVLILGAGTIGKMIAVRARAFGMRVLGLSRHRRSTIPEGFDKMIDAQEILDAYSASDFVVDCLPLTPETQGILDAKAIDAMPSQCVFINVGRAGTVDEPALLDALRSGRIRGAALDVFEHEPLPVDSPLWSMKNVIISPHNSGWGDGRDARGIELIELNLRKYRSGETLDNLIDRVGGY